MKFYTTEEKKEFEKEINDFANDLKTKTLDELYKILNDYKEAEFINEMQDHWTDYEHYLDDVFKSKIRETLKEIKLRKEEMKESENTNE